MRSSTSYAFRFLPALFVAGLFACSDSSPSNKDNTPPDDEKADASNQGKSDSAVAKDAAPKDASTAKDSATTDSSSTRDSSKEPSKDAQGEAGNGGDKDSSSNPSRWSCPEGPFGSPLEDVEAPTKFAAVPLKDAFNQQANGFGIIEGPVWTDAGLLFSEIVAGGASPPPARILLLKGEEVSVVDEAVGSNGLAIDGEGHLFVASHAAGGIVRYDLSDMTKKVDVIKEFDGKRFNSPNDLAIRSDGTIYFSDPTWQAPTPNPQAKTRVYRLPSGATEAVVVDDARAQPNGVTLSIDEKTLYVSGGEGIFAYEVSSDGSTGTGRKFAPTISSGVDGMTVDCAGNLYATNGPKVVVLAPDGKELGTITVTGVQDATNVAFGGPDHQTLYITALGSGTQRGLLSVHLKVPGRPY